MSTRRTTRRAAAAEAEADGPVLHPAARESSPATEPPRKRGRKSKAAIAAAQTLSQAPPPSKLPKASSTATATATTTASTTSTSTSTSTAPAAAPRRTTRAAKAAGNGSPLRVYQTPEKKRKRTRQQTASPAPESTRSGSLHDDSNDEQGIFFSKNEAHPSPSPSLSRHSNSHSLPEQNTISSSSANESTLVLENKTLRDKVHELEARVIELEKANFNLVKENTRVVDTYDGLLDKIASLQHEAQHNNPPSPLTSQPLSPFFSDVVSPQSTHSPISFDQQLSYHLDEPSQNFTHSTPPVRTNKFTSDFDTQLLNLPTPAPARPMFVNGSESAIALLQKIENAAKEPPRCQPSVTDEELSLSEPDIIPAPESQPPSGTKRTHEQSATPERPISIPSSFFTRSFSAIKSIKSLFSSPAPDPPPPAGASFTVPCRTVPSPNSLAETLSAPPTPVGERIRTPAKKKKTDHMTRTLLKGVDPADKKRAEEWVRQILPGLKNDPTFREKRKRLETPVLIRDLDNFPSSKPWETGFGDPLGELDEDDVVPVWAVYLEILAEEEEHTAKKRKATHRASMDSEDIPTIDEQYAAGQSLHSSPQLFNSHGNSPSVLDYQPRRSTVPSPMFDTSPSHHQGGNIFKELQSHNAAAQLQKNDRETAQSTTNNRNPQDHTITGSFSVPDDSDSDSDDDNASPLWTQAPPPAPVPAHAPLPGGSAADAPSAASPEKPVDEVERQRQKLMKHTPAKPSRLREATYPSPSLLSDAGNESVLSPTPAHIAAVMAPIFKDMPTAELIELDEEEQADFDALVNSDQYKRQLAANPWPAAIITYDSDEEDLSPL